MASSLLTPPELTADVRAAWDTWIAERPARVREVAARFLPFVPYRLKSTGQVCRVIGFHEGVLTCGQVPCEDPERPNSWAIVGPEERGPCRRPHGHDGDHDERGDVTVYVHAEHPELGAITAVRVFGIKPDDLEPWPSSPAEPEPDVRAVIIGVDVIEGD